MGSPKGLLRHPDGTPWVARALDVLIDGGCDRAVLVVGAAGDDVTALARRAHHRDRVDVVEAPDWADGMGASLRAGLAAAADLPPGAPHLAGRSGTRTATRGAGIGPGLVEGTGTDGAPGIALVHLVDLPDVGADCVARVLAAASDETALARAWFAGRPGHPVALGRRHWGEARSAARGDRGARDFLSAADVLAVDCTDLAGGGDVDLPSPPG